VAGKQANDTRRRRQAETIEQIVAARTRPNSRYLVLGDLNDTPDAPVPCIDRDIPAARAGERAHPAAGDPPSQGRCPTRAGIGGVDPSVQAARELRITAGSLASNLLLG